MQSDDGILSAKQKEKAIAWLNAKAPNLSCPACQTRRFSVGDHFLSPPIFYGRDLIIGGPSYPQFFVVCENCAHMLQFSAVAADIIERSTPEPSDVPEKEPENQDG